MKKTALNILTIMATTALMIGVAQNSQAYDWDAGSVGDWTDSANWEGADPGEYPGSEGVDVSARIGGAGSQATVNQDISINPEGGGAGNFSLGSDSSESPATLYIENNLTARNFTVGNSTYQHGIVNHTAGTLQLNSTFTTGFRIGSDSAATVAYNFGSSTDLGANNPSVTYNTRLALREGDLSVSMSGYGSWSGERFEAWMATGNSLDLRVQGGNLDISLDDGNWGTVFAPGVTYTAVIDSTGISTWNSSAIRFRDQGTGESAAFALELSGYTFNYGEEFVILDAGSFFHDAATGFRNIANDDVLTVDGYEFRANYRTEEGNEQFVLTAIPEPGSVLLLGVGGLMLALLRRKLR